MTYTVRKAYDGASGRKRDLRVTMSSDDANKIVGQHGLKGPLPKELSREDRMRAYEARYVAAGGHRSEKWNDRARTADKVRTASLAAATGAAAGLLATRTKIGGRAVGRIATHIKPEVRQAMPRHLENAGLGAATVGGAAELGGTYARRKRSQYSSAPGGVAASALRRMQDYTP